MERRARRSSKRQVLSSSALGVHRTGSRSDLEYMCSVEENLNKTWDNAPSLGAESKFKLCRSIAPSELLSFVRDLALNPTLDSSASSVLKLAASEAGNRYAREMLSAESEIILAKHQIQGKNDVETSSRRSDSDGVSRHSTHKGKNQSKSKKRQVQLGRVVPTECHAFIPALKSKSNYPARYEVQSTQVWAPDRFIAQGKVEKFLDDLDQNLVRRDGFGCTRFGEAFALRTLMEKDGDCAAAMKAVNFEIRPDQFIGSGVGKSWTDEEKNQLLTAVLLFADDKCDFAKISRDFVPTRSTMEVTSMYYLYCVPKLKVQGFVSGFKGLFHGDVLYEKIGPVLLTEKLRTLARTPCDGFPVDCRVTSLIKRARVDHYRSSIRRKRVRKM